jgi:hypothetical protein
MMKSMQPQHKIHSYLLCLLMLIATTASAENSTSSGGYTIHHNAFQSDFLTPEIAKTYNIPRSKLRGLVNISVIKDKSGSAMSTPVKARIKIKAEPLGGIPKDITLMEIIENDAIYYIGDFPIINREIVNFTLEVTPEGQGNPIHARFSQQFYID